MGLSGHGNHADKTLVVVNEIDALFGRSVKYKLSHGCHWEYFLGTPFIAGDRPNFHNLSSLDSFRQPDTQRDIHELGVETMKFGNGK